MNSWRTKYRNAGHGCQLFAAAGVDQLLAWLCPFGCVLCGESGDNMDLCAGCRADLPWQQRACGLCAIPLVGESTASLCPRCSAKPPAYSACFAAFIYEYPLDHLIAALKFRRQTYMGRITGELLAAYLKQTGIGEKFARPDLVVPVPLHQHRCRERGYNQAELLADAVCKKLRLRCDPDLLIRRRPTATQSRLDRQERLKNLQGAFFARRAVKNLRIALVDDVVTTGATTSACVRELLRAGAADVQVWAVARAIREAEKCN